jgi:hypothetical protein
MKTTEKHRIRAAECRLISMSILAGQLNFLQGSAVHTAVINKMNRYSGNF